MAGYSGSLAERKPGPARARGWENPGAEGTLVVKLEPGSRGKAGAGMAVLG